VKIAIQGEHGSFHHEAAMRLEPDAEVLPQPDFAGVFRAALQGEADYGLCAIENNIHGAINDVYRLLERHDVWIVRDTCLHIAQQLIGPRAISLTELAAADNVQVLSQAPALAQVELWLGTHLPKAIREEMSDTALSVREVVKRGDARSLAVAGEFAAKTYGGVIVAKDIQDERENYTRFILFSKDRRTVPDAAHASMILKTSHAPGALLHALQVFADHNCNLTKLDSQPIPGDQRHYAFYIDYELATPDVSKYITTELEQQGCSVKLLGEYVSA
jgi:prephenate dehydratase